MKVPPPASLAHVVGGPGPAVAVPLAENKAEPGGSSLPWEWPLIGNRYGQVSPFRPLRLSSANFGITQVQKQWKFPMCLTKESTCSSTGPEVS
jgi:hypothetical protein